MTVVTTPNVHPESAADTDGQSINLYRLGMLFVVRCRYWTCRAGNDADDLELSADRIDAEAIASFGTKDLLDAETTRIHYLKVSELEYDKAADRTLLASIPERMDPTLDPTLAPEVDA